MVNLSFIIPAYNASNTIVRCLDSIYSLSLQTDDFEVIVIDDCSTDNTIQIIKQYAAIHRNLTLLCQPENHRQGAARNRGIKEATGTYIMCVDSDDIVEHGIPNAIKFALQSKVDVLFCNYYWMYSQSNIELRYLPLSNGSIMSSKDFCEKYFDTIINTCPISYIWRRDYLSSKGIAFVENRRMEDFDWIERNIYNATAIGYSIDIIYRVMTFENLNSTTHTSNPETSADWAHAGYRRMKFCDTIRQESPNFANKLEIQSRYFVANIMKIRNFTKFTPDGILQLKNRLGDDVINYLLSKGKWKKETYLCLKYIKIFVWLDYILYPIAIFGRNMVQIMRKMK